MNGFLNEGPTGACSSNPVHHNTSAYCINSCLPNVFIVSSLKDYMKMSNHNKWDSLKWTGVQISHPHINCKLCLSRLMSEYLVLCSKTWHTNLMDQNWYTQHVKDSESTVILALIFFNQYWLCLLIRSQLRPLYYLNCFSWISLRLNVEWMCSDWQRYKSVQ